MHADHNIRRRLRLPAFGAELADLRRQGLAPRSGVIRVAVDDWSLRGTRADMGRVVVPDDLDPADLDLHFVSGLDVVVVYDGGRTVAARARAVIDAAGRCGAVRVHWIDAGATVPQLRFARTAGSRTWQELPG